MGIELFKQQLDNEYEGSIFDAPPSKKEREDSRLSFLDSLKKAVEKGGKVVVEQRGNMEYFSFKEQGGPSFCISEDDAIQFCGYKKQ